MRIARPGMTTSEHLKFSPNDEIYQIDLGLRRTPSDGGALHRMIGEEALIHLHAHDAPFERAVDDPGAHILGIEAPAARGFVAFEQVGQITETADNLVRDTE